MKDTVVKVDGMNCGHCKSAVEEALANLDGVESAKVSLEKGEVSVTYDESETDLDAIKEAITGSGFEPK